MILHNIFFQKILLSKILRIFYFFLLLITMLGCSSSERTTILTNGSVITISPKTPSINIQSSPTVVVSTTTALVSSMSSSNTSIITTQQPTTSNVSTEPSTIINWEYFWLRGIPCSPPCWLGITPNITKLDDAVKILKQNQYVNSESVKTESTRISWSWKQGGYSGFATFDTKVSGHPILTMGAAYMEKFKLGAIIKTYGEPNYVKANYGGGIPSFYLFWFSKGFSIGINGNQFEKPPEITTDLLLGGLTGGPFFFGTTTLDEYITNSNPSLTIKEFVPWQGFKNFDFYCRDAASGTSCKY